MGFQNEIDCSTCSVPFAAERFTHSVWSVLCLPFKKHTRSFTSIPIHLNEIKHLNFEYLNS